MNDAGRQREIERAIERIIDRWCPEESKKKEPMNVKFIRTLLHLHAYDEDAQRVLRGEKPVRNDYPLPLPNRERFN